jgi:hypothetical protein
MFVAVLFCQYKVEAYLKSVESEFISIKPIDFAVQKIIDTLTPNSIALGWAGKYALVANSLRVNSGRSAIAIQGMSCYLFVFSYPFSFDLSR